MSLCWKRRRQVFLGHCMPMYFLRPGVVPLSNYFMTHSITLLGRSKTCPKELRDYEPTEYWYKEALAGFCSFERMSVPVWIIHVLVYYYKVDS